MERFRTVCLYSTSMMAGFAFVLVAVLFLGCTGLVVVGLFLWIRHWKGRRKADPSSLQGRPHVEARSGESVLRLGDTCGLGEDSADVTIAMAEDARFDLPTFSVAPRTPLGLPPATPIAFPEDPAFESRFWVCGPDSAAVRAQLSEKIRRELVARGHQYWQGHGRTFGTTKDVVLDAREAEALLLDLEVVVNMLLS